MHEMAIARSVLDIALAHAARGRAAKIRNIGLLVGEMTGVEPEALRFCFAALAQGTAAEEAELKLKETPLVVRCLECGGENHLQQYRFFCPACDSARLEIVSGREMQVEYLEVD